MTTPKPAEPDPGNEGQGERLDGPVSQPIQHASVSARVPSHVAHGTLSTGVVVFEGPHEFVLDFVLRLGPPHAVVARVVMPHEVFGQLSAALDENIRLYTERFGPPAPMPIAGPLQSASAATAEPGPKIEDVYDQVRLADEMLSGAYANAVMISHSPAEFWFDFITNFFPRSAVSARVYMSAQQILRIRETLHSSWRGHLAKKKRS